MVVHYAETDMNANLFLNLSLGILLIDYAVVWACVWNNKIALLCCK